MTIFCTVIPILMGFFIFLAGLFPKTSRYCHSPVIGIVVITVHIALNCTVHIAYWENNLANKFWFWKGNLGWISPLFYIKKRENSIKQSKLFSFLWCIASKASNHSNLFSSLQLVLCHVETLKCIPIHHHNADYFWIFGMIEFIQTYVRKSVLLGYG